MGDVVQLPSPKEDVGVRATEGDLIFWRDAHLDTRGRRLVRAGIVTSVAADGRALRWREINGSEGEHTNIGVDEITLLPRTLNDFDFGGGLTALRRRKARGFTSMSSAARFMSRWLLRSTLLAAERDTETGENGNA